MVGRFFNQFLLKSMKEKPEGEFCRGSRNAVLRTWLCRYLPEDRPFTNTMFAIYSGLEEFAVYSLSSRTFLFTLLVFGMIMNNFYNSKLTSNHIVEWNRPPFDNLLELARSTDYYPVLVRNTSMQSIIWASGKCLNKRLRDQIAYW